MKISEILKNLNHRPWKLPAKSWKYYQEWNDAIFLHWEVPADELRKYIPTKLNLDLYNGKAYVSLVAFTMEKIRPKNFPAVSFISDFHEINLRTYIVNDNKKGVYFLSIEAEKSLSAFIARTFSGLPYQKSAITRKSGYYKSSNASKGFSLDVEFDIATLMENKSDLDKWLTERYCLYMEDGMVYRYEIHHPEWKLKNLNISRLNLEYKIGNINFSSKKPDLVHYSEGVKVLAWNKEKVLL